MKFITDLHVEWHSETGEIHYVIEFADGREETIATFIPKREPHFISEDPSNSFEYQMYYNDALSYAHAKGYMLEGEFDKQRFVSKVAAFVYATAVLNQEDSSCHVYLKDIEDHFTEDFFPEGWKTNIELLKDIQDEIFSYPGCGDSGDTCWLDISGYDEYGDACPTNIHDPEQDAFNLCLFTNYIACDYDADGYDDDCDYEDEDAD